MRMKTKIVINCALPYANNSLHIGHIAGAYLSGDIFNRYSRISGHEVMFICGSDEYGTPIAIKAEKEGRTPMEIATIYHQEHLETFRKLDIEFDYFGRTTDEVHQEFSEKFFMDLMEKGYLEKRMIIASYCAVDKRFLPDRYVNGTCPNCSSESARGDQCDECGRINEPQELINPRCAICGNPIDFRETDHIFFTASKLDSEIREWLQGKEEWRNNVRIFSLNMIKDGLKDRSMTRDMDWGVKVPMEGMEGKRIYVWFEALLGYISNSIKYSRIRGDENYWKEMYSSGNIYYFMGKDNIFFHSILLPAMNMASGKYPLPKMVTANEYLTYRGKKFSKSRGIGYTVNEILEHVDRDSIRYYVSSVLPESSDSDFTLEEMKEKVNSELNGKYGNLVNRVVTFAAGKGIVPKQGPMDDLDREVMEKMKQSLAQYREEMDRIEFRKALAIWLESVKAVNTYFNQSKPWDTIKTDRDATASRIWHSLKAIEYLTLMIYPFVPSGAIRAWKTVHGSEPNVKDEMFSHLGSDCDFHIKESGIIFSKIEIESEGSNQMHLVVGKIIEAEDHPNADSLLHFKVDLGTKVIDLVAGLKKYYSPEKILGRKIIVVENLKHSKIRGIESQGMLLAAQDSNGAHILTTDEKEGTEITLGNEAYDDSGTIAIDDLKEYDLRTDVSDGKTVPTGMLNRKRLILMANGKPVSVDGNVESRSQIR